jgi:hypothetical protein
MKKIAGGRVRYAVVRSSSRDANTGVFETIRGPRHTVTRVMDKIVYDKASKRAGAKLRDYASTTVKKRK